MKYITNTNAIILVLSDNKNVRVEKSDKNYAKILKAFSLPKDEQEAEVIRILNPVVLGKRGVVGVEGFELIDDEIHYQGERLPFALEQKVLSIMEDGLPLEHFAKFWDRLQKNPSATSISELVDFLSYKELPITDDGYFIAYKGVDASYWSVKGNKSTKVIILNIETFQISIFNIANFFATNQIEMNITKVVTKVLNNLTNTFTRTSIRTHHIEVMPIKILPHNISDIWKFINDEYIIK